MEGKRWSNQTADPRMREKNTTGLVQVETKDAMGKRADIFLNEHFVPLLDDFSMPPTLVVAIVSHGIFLSILWKRLLKRLPPKSITLSADASLAPPPSLEHLGGWSNTGLLELLLTRSAAKEANPSESGSSADATAASLSSVKALSSSEGTSKDKILPCDAKEVIFEASSLLADLINPSIKPSQPNMIQGWKTLIVAINGKDHLKGLKRTGGGVGTSRHDASQRSIETFFKRRKTE